MELIFADSLRTLKLDLVFTLAFAALFLFFGRYLLQRIGFLNRFSLPAPIIGGLLFALTVFALRSRGLLGVTIDTSLRLLLQTIFFTTIGLTATLQLLRRGGWQIGFFWLIASALSVVQNLVGLGAA